MRLFFVCLMALAGCIDNMLTYEVIEEVEVFPPVYAELFTQPSLTNGFDIIWVIDRSGSMNNHDAELLTGIEQMLTSLPIDLQWRIGIVSTDPDEALANENFPLVPGDTIDDAVDRLNALGNPWGEFGLEALYTYMVLGAYSSTWLRYDAGLLVVFVSDEDDQSMTIEPSDIVDYLRSARSTSAVSAIVGLNESSCADETGERYLEVVTAKQGTSIDICSNSWTAGVEAATQALEPYESWALTHFPVPETINVFVNGKTSSDWVYDITNNVVEFTVIPEGGDVVQIVYGVESYAPDTGV